MHFIEFVEKKFFARSCMQCLSILWLLARFNSIPPSQCRLMELSCLHRTANETPFLNRFDATGIIAMIRIKSHQTFNESLLKIQNGTAQLN